MFQNSCSELLVDTTIHDPEVACEKFKALGEKHGWHFSPSLTVELLTAMKVGAKEEDYRNYDCDFEPPKITVSDRHYQNSTTLEYGYNGYLETGFRLDTGCCDGDRSQYPFLDIAIEELGGKLIACDGGHKYGFEDWKDEQALRNRE